MAEKYISDRDTLERLVRLETEVHKDQELRKDKCEAIQASIKLAKETVKEAETLARTQVDKHFETVNNFQKRIDRAEATYATVNGTDTKIATTKEVLESKIEALSSRVDTKIDSIREGLESKLEALDERIDTQSKSVEQDIEKVSRLVYIGVGLVLAIEFVARFLIT